MTKPNPDHTSSSRQVGKVNDLATSTLPSANKTSYFYDRMISHRTIPPKQSTLDTTLHDALDDKQKINPKDKSFDPTGDNKDGDHHTFTRTNKENEQNPSHPTSPSPDAHLENGLQPPRRPTIRHQKLTSPTPCDTHRTVLQAHKQDREHTTNCRVHNMYNTTHKSKTNRDALQPKQHIPNIHTIPKSNLKSANTQANEDGRVQPTLSRNTKPFTSVFFTMSYISTATVYRNTKTCKSNAPTPPPRILPHWKKRSTNGHHD